MSINIATSGVTNIYIGTSGATAVYVGNTQVWGGTPAHDYSQDYFTIKALEGGTFTWDVDNVEYSLNDGVWTTWDKTNGLTVSADDAIRLKSSTNTAYGTGNTAHTINATGLFDVEGNSMSLFFGDNFSGQTLKSNNYLFKGLFSGNVYVKNAENLILPSTALGNQAYYQMFRDCSSLITCPKELPATTIGTSCYGDMFMNTSITNVPDILPALTVKGNCYLQMFMNTPITKAPVLPAPETSTGCYRLMFYGCTNLKYIKCLATNYTSYNHQNWVTNVSATGTFVKDANMSSWTTGNDGIPNGWTTIDA